VDVRIRSIEKRNDIGNGTHDLPACSIVPQPATLQQTNAEMHKKGLFLHSVNAIVFNVFIIQAYVWGILVHKVDTIAKNNQNTTSSLLDRSR
jgi:p-aminobenzoyl-glutamate transporter AbgT